MRELIAKWMAAFTGLLVCILAVLFALIQNQPTPSVGASAPGGVAHPGVRAQAPSKLSRDDIDAELGRTVYDLLRCRTCHSIAGEGNRRNPLDGVGNRLDAEEIREWVLAPGEIDPDIMKPDFTFLSTDQVNLLVKYIQSLK
jgi:hypothetical protein